MRTYFSSLNQIIYESTADIRICKRNVCCSLRDFVPKISSEDTSNAAYMSQKEQNYIWLSF